MSVSGVQVQVGDEFADLFDPSKENTPYVKQVKAQVSQVEQAVEEGNKLKKNPDFRFIINSEIGNIIYHLPKLKELDALLTITEMASRRR